MGSEAGDDEEAGEEEELLSESGEGESESDGNADSSSEGTPPPSPPPIQLPDRSTRGKKLRKVVNEEEEDADDQFWKQDFFAEEDGDDDYESSSESEDVPDSDFDQAESDSEGEGGGTAGANEEEAARLLKVKKSTVKPPGWKQAAARRAQLQRAKRAREQKQAAAAEQGPEEGGGDDDDDGDDSKTAAWDSDGGRGPTLRLTRAIRPTPVSEPPKKPAARKSTSTRKSKDQQPALTMEVVLRKAAADQLANEASLKLLLAKEEETKAAAMAARIASKGPHVRFKSQALKPEAGGSQAARLLNTVSFVNMGTQREPDLYRPQTAAQTPRLPPELVLDSNGMAWPRVKRFLPCARENGSALVCPSVQLFKRSITLPWTSGTLQDVAYPLAPVPGGGVDMMSGHVLGSGLTGVATARCPESASVALFDGPGNAEVFPPYKGRKQRRSTLRVKSKGGWRTSLAPYVLLSRSTPD